MVRNIKISDFSVLENYHCRESYKLIIKYDLLANVSKEEVKIFRRRFIDVILATDMSNHIKHINNLTFKADNLDIKNGENVSLMITDDLKKNYDNQQNILDLIIHSADISNPTKPFVIYSKMVDLLFEEFFIQGDLERKNSLPLTYLCDRTTTDIDAAQVGFIKYLVKPTFNLLTRFTNNLSLLMENMDLNLSIYEGKVNEKKNLTSKS